MKPRLFFTAILALCASLSVGAQEFSTAGFFALEGTSRDVFCLNPAWRFFKGDADGAQAPLFDDSAWSVVNLPDGTEYLPVEASGCINYQGPVWYRKHFTPSEGWRGLETILHFEAIMGKSRVYLNGELLKESFTGYLPVIADVTGLLKWGEDNVIAVWADNSNDPDYVPGKPQEELDFTYFGGIYRDCWMVTHGKVFISDPNVEDVVAGGGLTVGFENVSASSAEITLRADIRNAGSKPFSGRVEYELQTRDGKTVAKAWAKVKAASGALGTASTRMKVSSPRLWSPATPDLYNLLVRVKDGRGATVDGYRRRIGIRTFEFRGAEGFYLNGEPFDHPLVGANRHQDFAVLGHALPNSLHWRDAKKLRDAGLEVIRNAHCPQDPAFLDACDELGLLVINTIPGWQFFNKDNPVFEQRAYDDLRQLIRRDRNRACQFIWEPLINETWLPEEFADNVQKIVAEEYPFTYSYTACNSSDSFAAKFPVIYEHPGRTRFPEKSAFTREWGDNVDDWSSHNSNSRCSRAWGEVPMLIQARHYADLDRTTNWDILYNQERRHFGGALWHSFDHQRGYHPDPFYGGIMDNFRQPKYSYWMFMAQRPAEVRDDVPYATGPMVYIAHEMTPFSPADVTVYSNCDEVRLTYRKDGTVLTYTKDAARVGMPSPIITFENVYDFNADKRLRREEDVYLLAEGIIDGEVVATHKVTPSRRPTRIALSVDNEGMPLVADGSDCVVVVASITDDNGEVKHLSNESILFEIEGEGELVGDSSVGANPRIVEWGTAPVIVRSTLVPGKIRIRASILYEGSQKAAPAEIEIETVPSGRAMVYDEAEMAASDHSRTWRGNAVGSVSAEGMEQVFRDQKAFGE